MSDGPSDAYYHIRGLVDKYLELLVKRFESIGEPNLAAIFESVDKVAKELLGYAGPGWNFADLSGRFGQYLQASLEAWPLITLDMVFPLLFLKGEYTKIIRLQKATSKDLLIIFTDDEHHLTGNSVFYCGDQDFEDGDQDIILGALKKRNPRLFKRNNSLMITASWDKASWDVNCGYWHLQDVIEFLF